MKPFYYSWSIQSKVVDFSLDKCEGPYFIEDGRKILDGISSSFQAHFGHSFLPLKQSIVEQAKNFSIAPPKANFQLKQSASEKLLDLLNLRGRIFYTLSGAEAVENALKIARQIRDGKKILARKKSYHGASLGALSITGDWRSENHFGLQDFTIRIPEPVDDPDLIKLRQIVQQEDPENIAAICLETISGTNGVYSGDARWWRKLREFCDETGILMILDEVLVGFGRCKEYFAFHKYGIEPDIVCMSKGITGGYIPFGAVYTNLKICDFYENRVLSNGLTNYAHPLGLACMNTVIDTLKDPSFIDNKILLERDFAAQLNELKNIDCVSEVRSHGLLAAIQSDKLKLDWQDFWKLGVYVYIKQGMLILAPPFILSTNELHELMGRIKEALKLDQGR